MELLETKLQNSLFSKTRRIKNKEILSYAKEDCDLVISTLFNIIEKIIDNYPKTNNLYAIYDFFEYVDVIKEEVIINRDLFNRKTAKILKKIDYIKTRKIKNKKKLKKELEEFRQKLERKKDHITTINKENIEENFIEYLMAKKRDLSYIDFVFNKMPDVMKIKDSAGLSLYRNIVNKYLECIEKDNIKDIEYYKKLLLLITSKKDFNIKDTDKKSILLDINTRKNKIEKNKEKDYLIDELKKIIFNNNKIDMNNIASKYNIEINFNNNILSLLNNKLHINKDDREIIDEYIISIDGDNAVEIDDALSCKKLDNGNYLLGIHIASVLGYFKYDSEIVQNAFNRIKSIYFHNKELGINNMIPIFPLEFSKEIASLKEGEEKLTRSYLFEVDKEGNIINKRFCKSIIKNNNKMTYEEVNEILEKGTSDKILNDTINNLKEVTKILSKKYKLNEVYELIKENSNNASDLRVKTFGSEQIVYQSMLLTNNKVAEFFHKNNYPCLYRVHNVEDKVNNKIEMLVNGLVENYGGEQKKHLYNLLTGIYPKGTYDVKGSHNGLKLDNYCHCTSCLRRSADILVEHGLEICYDKEPTKAELEELKKEILLKRDLIKSKEAKIDWFIEDFNKTFYKRRYN